MMHIDDLMTMLARTPTTVRTILEDLPAGLLHANEGEGTFSPFDVLRHLIRGERELWVPRAEWILEHGPAVPFPPFDPTAISPADEDATLEGSLREFESLREAGVAEVRRILDAGADLDRRGRHPAFGDVTLGELLATWGVHDLDHIAQIMRVVAGQFESDVGPWRAYLPILHPRD